LVFWPAIPVSGWQTQDAFSGEATVLRATITTVLGITTTVDIVDAGPLPSSGGAFEKSQLTVNVSGLATAEVAHAATIGQGNHSDSEASVANLILTVAGNTIVADLLMASAEAKCENGAASVAGDANIAGLFIDGAPIAISGQPNQTIQLPVGKLIINEQSSSVSGNTGSITVNALHVVVAGVAGVADVVVSSAHADITCGGVPECEGKDFVTGAGDFTGSPTNGISHFAVAGGIQNNGTLFGHLESVDHGANGPRVHGTSVTKYVVLSSNTREIDGTAEVNGQHGFTYKVVVTDNGEPDNAYFSLGLSNGYAAGGKVQEGEIEIHHPCD
jgi:uncharacterized Zn-binding protein involved in type VI secretion